MIVRPATLADVPDILKLIVALATYERAPDAVKATEASLTETLFTDGAQVHAIVADLGGRVVGVAVWFLNYSTWTGKPGLYLEDLFVADAARGTGTGKALIKALAREAKARGCARIDWAVLDWNVSAMEFYRAVGGRAQTGWQPWRIDGATLEELAQ